MRNMKDSGIEWIGNIPSEWRVLYAFQCFEQVKNKNAGMAERNLLSLSYGKIITKNIDTVEGLLPDSYETYNIINRDDIVLRLTDLQNDQKSLRVGISEQQGIITSAYTTLRNKSNNLPRYMYYYLHSFDTAKGFYGMGAGVRQGLNWEELKHLKLIIPTSNDQIQIVECLDWQCSLIDSIIEKTKASIEEYKKLKQAIITKAVTQGVRGDRPMKDSGIEWIGEVPSEWKISKIKYVSSVSRGLFNHRPRNDERYYNGIYPFIQTSDVARAQKYITSYSQSLNELGKSVSKEFPVGTITMTIAANIGDIAILGINAFFPDSVIGIVPFKGTDNNYLFYVLSCMKNEFMIRAAINTQLNLNIERVKDVYIPYSESIDEQREIADFLDQKCNSIETIILTKKRYITELESYKRSIIYEYVTGKKEVPST